MAPAGHAEKHEVLTMLRTVEEANLRRQNNGSKLVRSSVAGHSVSRKVNLHRVYVLVSNHSDSSAG